MLKYFNSQAFGWGLSRDFIKNRPVTAFFYSIFAWRRLIPGREVPARPQSRGGLVKLIWDDGVLDQQFEGNDFESVFVGGFEDDRAGGSGLLDLQPAGGTDAPAIAGLEPGESELGHRSGEVVAQCLGGCKKGSVDDAADGVDAVVFGARLATTCAVKTRHGFAATDVERLAEDVFAAILDGFDGGHQDKFSVVSSQLSVSSFKGIQRDFKPPPEN
jgi:hypothetical protein